MLQQAGIEFDTVLYMKEKPDRTVLESIISKLEDPPGDLVRRDKFFRDKIAGEGFDEATLEDPEVVIELLERHARLFQRPVVVTADTAIVGRPRDRVPALFADELGS